VWNSGGLIKGMIKMSNFTIEDLDRILDYPTIEVATVIEEPAKFIRVREFEVDGNKFSIEWWANLSYLKIDDTLIIPFDTAELTNTWPNRSKMNIQFQYKGHTCVVLKVDSYD